MVELLAAGAVDLRGDPRSRPAVHRVGDSQLLRFIVYAPRVDSEVLCAAIAGYLLSGFAWSLAYALLGRLDPNSFVFTLVEIPANL